MTTQLFTPGGYRFIPAVFQYSGGVAAEPGFRIERVVFRRPVPLAAGFQRVESVIKARGRPLTAFCACELRSPAPFTDQGFRDFNELYVGTLAKWGIYDGKINPVARSNVCPEIAPPPEPSFHAFSFTVPSDGVRPLASSVVSNRNRPGEGSDPVFSGPSTFVSPAARGARRRGDLPRTTVRYGETSPDAIREKALSSLMRGSALGPARPVLGNHYGHQVYTVHDSTLLADEIVRRGGLDRLDLAILPAAGAGARV